MILEKSHGKIVDSTYAVMEIHVHRFDAFQVQRLGFMPSPLCKLTGLYVCDICQVLRRNKKKKSLHTIRED